MYSHDVILEKLKSILVEEFEVDENAIKLNVSLYEDLDIDSIDAVDLMVKLREFTGKKIKPEDFKNVSTVDDIVNAVYELCNE